MDQKSFSDWVKKQLSTLLGFQVPDEMIQMILNHQKKEELEKDLCSLLDVGNEAHFKFMRELISKKEKLLKNSKTSKEPSNIHPKQSANQSKQQHSQKSNSKQQPSKNTAQSTPSNQQQSNKNKKASQKNESEKAPPNNTKPPKDSGDSSGKKKKKFTTVYDGSTEGSCLLEGRRKCDCQASKHKLINNCLHCGRIVCEQEGSGPCLFCSNLVCSREERNILNSRSKQSDLLLQKLYDKERPVDSGLDQAIAQRDKLLEYDKTSEKRTTVIDDESDYYSVNSVWLSPEERDKLRQKEDEMRARKHKSARYKRYTIDFAGRQVLEVQDDEIYDLNDQDKLAILNKKLSECHINDSEDNLAPATDMQPEFQENAVVKKYKTKGFRDPNRFDDLTRVQDKEYMEISDMGFCLSMHQPWASLLVAGIKKHEGRTWYTHHRGRLWIAAGSKPPVESEIQRVENEYRFLRGDDTIFPSSYPTGCLLGCVNVIDCLSQEEYQRKYPDGENDSPFVIICEDPVSLPFKFLISGQHKIYRLDSKIHHAALKALEKIKIY